MGEHLVMRPKERQRKVEFRGVREGQLTLKEAAAKLGLSYRQVRAPLNDLRLRSY